MSSSLKSLAPLALILVGLLGYNFMSAQWTPPPVGTVPPANNVPAPVNVGSTTQSKLGNLNANIFAAQTICALIGIVTLWVGIALIQPVLPSQK